MTGTLGRSPSKEVQLPVFLSLLPSQTYTDFNQDVALIHFQLSKPYMFLVTKTQLSSSKISVNSLLFSDYELHI